MKWKKKIKSRAGFSLAEMMLAVLILLLVSIIVATGVPAARNAYYKVVLGSNAQILLSTATNALRGELGTARDILIDDDATKTEGGYVTYFSAETGGRSKIYKGTDEKGRSTILLQEYAGAAVFGVSGNQENSGHALVSEAASTDEMYITYDTVSYDKDEGTVTFSKFKVLSTGSDGKTLAGGDDNELVIRVFPSDEK